MRKQYQQNPFIDIFKKTAFKLYFYYFVVIACNIHNKLIALHKVFKLLGKKYVLL